MGRQLGLVGAIFALVGVVLLAISAYLIIHQRDFARAAVKAQGTVVDLLPQRDKDNHITHVAQIAFTDAAARSHRFSESISTSPPRFDRGEQVTVLYDPANPLNAVVDDFWSRTGALLIVGPLAVIFSLLGFAFCAYPWRQRRKMAWLKSNGLPISARFLEVVQDGRITVNGKSPYRVIVQGRHPLTGEEHRFTSEPIWHDPAAELEGGTLTVLCDPSDARRHIIDLSPWIGPDHA